MKIIGVKELLIIIVVFVAYLLKIISRLDYAIVFAVFIFMSIHEITKNEELYIRKLLRFQIINKMYKKETQKELPKIKHDILEKWKTYGTPITQIPDQGLSIEEIVGIIDKYSKIVNDNVVGKELSGTIYSKSLVSENKTQLEVIDEKDYKDPRDYLSKKLEILFTYAFRKAYLWNSLHHNEFGIASCIDYQVVQMVANMLGKQDNEKINGFVTSGGTESIMLAARIYKNQGLTRGIYNPVIIAGESVHASLIKAGMAYDIRIVLAKTDMCGNIDTNDLDRLISIHGGNLVALVCSAPSYPKGTIDDVKRFAELARIHKCGLHVDCCLGGFVVNFINDECANYLKIKEITSISVDTHKNGHAPKGSSVLLIRPHLSEYSIYSLPQWSGGIYGTPKDAGSQSCIGSLTALIAMLAIGKKRYFNMAVRIHNTVKIMSEIILKDNDLMLLSEFQSNVVAFKMNTKYRYGATYALAKEMANRGFVVNTLNDDSVHFCVTSRSVDEQVIEKFSRVLSDSIDVVKAINESGEKFHGDAGLYGSLNIALNPNLEKLGWKKYLINKLFGKIGAHDMVKNYFVTLMDPY